MNPHAISLDLGIAKSSCQFERALHRYFPDGAEGSHTDPLYKRTGRLGHTVGMGWYRDGRVVVANSRTFVFDRTATGDVAPVGEIKGAHTGIRDEPWEMEVRKGKIFLAASNHLHLNLYAQVTIKPEYADGRSVPEDPWLNPELGFIGVWNVRDRGDVPPLTKIGGPFSQLVQPTGLALNPRDGEIYVTDSIRNGLFTFLVPDLVK